MDRYDDTIGSRSSRGDSREYLRKWMRRRGYTAGQLARNDPMQKKKKPYTADRVYRKKDEGVASTPAEIVRGKRWA